MRIAPLALLALALLIAALIHATLGARPVSPWVIAEALKNFNRNDFAHQVVLHFRLPRLLSAIMVGSGLALCGALLQALVSNPLAEPQILGLNAGAALAVVGTAFFLPEALAVARPVVAAVGALAAFGVVLSLAGGGREGPTPLKLTLCGIAVSALAAALTAALLLWDQQTLDELRRWLAGDLAGQGFSQILPVLPAYLLAIVAAFLLAPQLAMLAMGDALAQGLGVRLHRLRLAVVVVAALLCGAAVALAGPIGFLGLLVPQLVRRLLGGDLRAVLAGCALAGPAALLLADTLARTAFLPEEIATGVVTGALGAPFFIAVVARSAR